MDNVTHGLMGLVAAGLLNNYAIPAKGVNMINEKKAVFWTALIASEIPDIDILYRFTSDAAYLNMHRGLSHSIGGILFLALAVALMVRIIYPSIRAKRLLMVSLICISLHVLLDLLTSYGTQVLYPFDHTRFALDVLPIVDIYLLILLVASLAFLMSRSAKLGPATFIAFLVFAYISARTGMHWYAYQQVGSQLPAEKKVQLAVIPGLFNPFSWQYIAKTTSSYVTGDVSLDGIEKTTREYPIIPGDTNAYAALKTPAAHIFLSFARFPYITCQQYSSYKVVSITDLRYLSKNHALFLVQVKIDQNQKVIFSGLGSELGQPENSGIPVNTPTHN
ncbi:MAG: metal-dependent hydrolase [Chitinophagales bacterium]